MSKTYFFFGVAAPPNFINLASPSYLSTWLETDNGQFVQQLAAGELTPAGPYQLKHTGLDLDGNPLPLPASRYRIGAFTHQQSGAVADVELASIGNASQYPAGNRAIRGFNNPDAELCITIPNDLTLSVRTKDSTPEAPAFEDLFLPAGTGVGFGVLGYTEGGVGLVFWLLSNPRQWYALHESSNLSGTHLAWDKTTNTLFVGALAVQGMYDAETGANYAGPVVVAVDLTTFQDKLYTGNANVNTLYGIRTHRAFALLNQQGSGTFITSLACAGGKLFVSFGLQNRVQVIDTTSLNTLQQVTVNYPFASAAFGNTLWLAHENNYPEVAERFTVNTDGSFTTTGVTVSGVTKIGWLAMSWDETKLVLTDVAEPTTQFFGSYSDQGELLVPRRIYYLNNKMYRYVGESGQYYTRAQWDALPTTGNALFSPMPTFMPSTSTHRLREFDPATGAAGRVNGTGDYVTNPNVANNKYCLCSESGLLGNSDNCYVAPTPNGGYLLRDKANARVIFLGPDLAYLDRRSSTGSTYQTAGNLTNPREHWIAFRRYSHNLDAPDQTLDGVAWNLEAQYIGTASQPGWSANWSKHPTTTKDGRTFGFVRNLLTYQQGLWEIGTTGFINWNLASKDLGSALQPDMSWLEVDNYGDGGAQRMTERLLSGYEQSGRPIMAPETTFFTLPATGDHKDPRMVSAPAGINARGQVVAYDIAVAITDADRSGVGCFHVAYAERGGTNWAARTMPATSKNLDVENPLGNVFYVGSNIQNAGGFYATAGDVDVFWKKDEFGWNGNNNHGKFLWKGKVAFEYGLPRYGAFPLKQARGGEGGNGDTGHLTIVDNVIRSYNGLEGGNGIPGINVATFRHFMPTLVEYAPVALTQWTPAPVRAGYSLMNSSRWTSSTGPYASLAIKENYDILPRDGVSRQVQFYNTDQSQPGNGVERCAFDAYDGELTSWRVDGKMFIRQTDNRYQSSFWRIVDGQNRIIAQGRRIINDDDTYSYVVNNQVLGSHEVAALQQEKLYWVRDFFLTASASGLRYQHAEYGGPVDLAPVDAQADVLHPVAFEFSYLNNQNGGYLAAVANLWFEPLV